MTRQPGMHHKLVLIRPPSRPRRRPPRCLHHFKDHHAKEEGSTVLQVYTRLPSDYSNSRRFI